MDRMRPANLIDIITMIRACYDKYASFRVAKTGMQPLTDTYQFVQHGKRSIPLA